MGAWGHLPFENDAALDWLSELQDQPTITFLRETFDAVSETPEYVEVDAASAAVAAVALLAMISGHRPYLPDVLPAGLPISRLRQKIDAALLTRIDAALQIIRDLERSELAQLWSESPHYADWLADHHVLVWLGKAVEVRKMETRVQLGRVVVAVGYVEG